VVEDLDLFKPQPKGTPGIETVINDEDLLVGISSRSKHHLLSNSSKNTKDKMADFEDLALVDFDK
jgi:hypothetical protein